MESTGSAGGSFKRLLAAGVYMVIVIYPASSGSDGLAKMIAYGVAGAIAISALVLTPKVL